MTDVADSPAPDEDAPVGGDASGADDGSDDSAADDSVADDGASGGPRPRVGLIVSGVVAVLLIGFVAVLATREPATERRANSELIGEVVPALSGATLDGGTFDIDDHRGRWVVVNFFATWCRPCVVEHPELVAFDEAHAATGDATVVSVVYDQADLDDVDEFFADNGGDWPVVTDARQSAVDYGVAKVPESYLVAPSGIVVQKYTGGVTQAMIDADIDALTAASQGEGS